jgi:hypothetical protein
MHGLEVYNDRWVDFENIACEVEAIERQLPEICIEPDLGSLVIDSEHCHVIAARQPLDEVSPCPRRRTGHKHSFHGHQNRSVRSATAIRSGPVARAVGCGPNPPSLPVKPNERHNGTHHLDTR